MAKTIGESEVGKRGRERGEWPVEIFKCYAEGRGRDRAGGDDLHIFEGFEMGGFLEVNRDPILSNKKIENKYKNKKKILE